MDILPQTWSESVCKALDAEAEPGRLLGHRLDGMVISQVAEARPEKISTLVCRCAVLLHSGESLVEAAQSERNAESKVLPSLIIEKIKGHTMPREEAIKKTLYGCCCDEGIMLARVFLQPEALTPDNFIPKMSTKRPYAFAYFDISSPI